MKKLKEVSLDIKAKKIAPFYFLYGEEEFFINSILSNIKKAFADKTGLNTKVFDEYNFDISEVNKYIINAPMMNDKKLIIFKNCPIFRQKNGDSAKIDSIIESLKKSSDINIVIIIMLENDKKYDKKYEDHYNKSNKFIELFDKEGVCLNLTKISDEDLTKYAYDHIRKFDVDIDKPELALLVSNCGNNITNLYNEVDKIISYIGDKKKITKDDINAISTKNVEESIYKLIDFFNSNHPNEAYKIYGDLLSEGINEYTIFIFLYKNYEKLLIVKDLCEKGLNIKEISEKLKISDYRIKNLIKSGSGYSKMALTEKLAKVTKLNNEYMKGNLSGNLMTELLF